MTYIKFSPGCFGKLPKFADFVKFNSGNSEILFFDKWIQNGLQIAKTKLGADFNSKYSSADLMQFIFPIQSSGNYLIGTLIQSNDKSGRKYPFIISTPIDNELGADNSHLIPTTFADYFSHSEQIITQLNEHEKLDEIISVIENNFHQNEANISHKKLQYQEYTNITTTNKLWNRLFGNFDDERKYLMMYNLIEILLPLKNKPLNNFTLGLKIPIVSESEFMYSNISFWIDVCLTLIGNKNIKPFLFWLKNSKTLENNLVLFLSQPPNENLAHFIDQSFLMDNICLTEKEGKLETSLEQMNPNYKNLLEQKEISLNQFLQSL
jgi:type VI secretion system ImpM family protein